MAWAYYNDSDPNACDWVRRLIRKGLIADGEVDQRDMREVQPEDLQGFDLVHLCSGIAGWDLAMQWSGEEFDEPAWTVSCPCPPFSAAGKRLTCPECKGPHLVWCPRRTGYAICAGCEHSWLADSRHIWPEVWRLVAGSRPGYVFGEQVASAAGLDWIAAVQASLDILRYDSWAEDRAASSVAAPHKRQRYWWIAFLEDGLADAGRTDSRQDGGRSEEAPAPGSGENLHRRYRQGRLADADGRDAEAEGIQRGGQQRLASQDAGIVARFEGWDQVEWLECGDGITRPVKPGVPPLAHGIPKRLVQLGGYGNAIVPQVASEFIKDSMEIIRKVRDR